MISFALNSVESFTRHDHRPCTCQESEAAVEWCFTNSHIVWYTEGRKPHADEKQTITSKTALMTVPECSQGTISLYPIPNNGLHLGCQNMPFQSNEIHAICDFWLTWVPTTNVYCRNMWIGSLCAVLLIAGLLLQQLHTTPLSHQPKCQ